MKIATSIKEWFARKSEIQPANRTIELPAELGGGTIEKYSPRYFELNVLPYFCGENFLQLFESVPEVFFPINYIASRIAGATFEVKRVKDDSIVYYRKEFNKFLDQPNCLMTDRELAQATFAMRIFDHDVDISYSTREPAYIRDNMCTLGVTTMSAESHVNPGGYHTYPQALEQFTVSDERTAKVINARLKELGREPVWKDWDASFDLYKKCV